LIRFGDWDEHALGPLDLEAVRALYQPVYHFRIQQDRYEEHAAFSSSDVAMTFYVLTGRMQVSDGTATYVLGTGQYVSLPSGSYTITYPEFVEHICVLELPEQVWPHEKELYATTFRPRLQKIDYRPIAHSIEPKVG